MFLECICRHLVDNKYVTRAYNLKLLCKAYFVFFSLSCWNAWPLFEGSFNVIWSFLILSQLTLNLSLLALFLCLSVLYPEQRIYLKQAAWWDFVVFLLQAVSCWNWRKLVACLHGLNSPGFGCWVPSNRDTESYAGGVLVVVSPWFGACRFQSHLGSRVRPEGSISLVCKCSCHWC